MVVGDVLVEKRRLNKTASVPMSRARRGSASTRLALAMCTYHGYGGGIPLVSFFFFKQKTAYEIFTRLEFRRVLFRSRIDGLLPLHGLVHRCPAEIGPPFEFLFARQRTPALGAAVEPSGGQGPASSLDWIAWDLGVVRRPPHPFLAGELGQEVADLLPDGGLGGPRPIRGPGPLGQLHDGPQPLMVGEVRPPNGPTGGPAKGPDLLDRLGHRPSLGASMPPSASQRSSAATGTTIRRSLTLTPSRRAMS